jgi:hypothetical protein
MLLPGEALYHAIGKKDKELYEATRGISLSDILSMIVNKVAVSQTQPETPMHLDDFDQPKHIRVIVKLRGMSPDMLEKNAKSVLDTMDSFDSFELTYMTGKKEKVGKKYAKANKPVIERLINDGIIIKVVKILSSGMKTTVFDKTASFDEYDEIYLEMLSSAV